MHSPHVVVEQNPPHPSTPQFAPFIDRDFCSGVALLRTTCGEPKAAEGNWRAGLTGLIGAATSLINSVFTPMIILLPLSELYIKRFSPRQALIAVLVSCVITYPWWVRSADLALSATTPSTGIAMNLVQDSWPIYHAFSHMQATLHDDSADTYIAVMEHEFKVMNASPVPP